MPIPPPDDNKHIVKEGEWVASIADEYGYTEWEKDVWNHSENSKYKEDRKDPHVLKEGDVLHIPSFEPKQQRCETGKKHTFELNVPTEILRIQFLDPEGEPIKDAEYFLTINRRSGRPFKQKNKKTDGDGRIEEGIPSDAVDGEIRIPDAAIESVLDFGYLAPMKEGAPDDSVRGAAQRLHGLGMLPTEHVPDDNKLNDHVVAALKRFAEVEQIKLKKAKEAGEEKDSEEESSEESSTILTDEMIKKLKERFGT